MPSVDWTSSDCLYSYTNRALGINVQEVAQISCLEPLVARLTAVASTLAGIFFLVMLIIGGIRYLTSGGDAKRTEAAKGTITMAFLGLLLIVAAYIILAILSSLTGFDLTIFKIIIFD